ncbi:MAG: hypothetical protein WC997_15765 [Porticoccaceae bacterium]
MAAAVPIIKVVGVALSAKAAYDGIKEGNFFKAVVGAVGAYYGVSSLATPATAGGASGVAGAAEGAAQTASTAGADTATKVASQTAAKGIEGAAMEGVEIAGQHLAKRAAYDGAPGLLTQIGDGIQKGAEWIDKKGFEPLREAVTGGEGKYAADGTLNASASNVGQGKGLLAWGKDNQEIVSAGAKLVGGYMEGKAEEDLIKRQERLIADRYDRMGSPVDVSRAGGIRWNPETRRFSQEIA